MSQKRVLPEPDEPITQALRLRTLAGCFGRVFIVRNSVQVKMMLFSNFGSIKGLMSFSVPHEVFCQVLFGSFLCLLNNNSGYDILELSFIPGGYNDAGITHIA